MKLSPKEIEKLMLHNAGFVAQKRYARGIKLNYPESVALIATQLLEFIREGESVLTLMEKGREILGHDDVMEGVAALLDTVQVEGTFPDGTKLVTVHQPINRSAIENGYALYGSGLTRTGTEKFINNGTIASPGESFVKAGEIELNAERPTIEITVYNAGNRSVQVGSHYPFIETNKVLKFDRLATLGYRLDIPSGTAIRFKPDETKTVQLVEIGGEQKVFGANALINGSIEGREGEIETLLRDKGYMETTL
ncbi:urease subunit gamma [Sphingobacterium sp. DN00404]|uniref:urease n=1 Tax=Sphingobacterium micropteri TaxID=2763501 RepID=A0ABR7YQD2_9SPHI|nr:urease subunit gamma [Sphingobacterium micropteri]MBD1433554.1 urease subunit gamma [Sphingobacterium micropteri]